MINLMAIVLILILFIMSFYANETRKASNKMFPGPLALPLLGNVHLALRTREAMYRFMFTISKEYNYKTFRAWLFHIPLILTADYEVAKMILSSNVQIDKSKEYRFFEPFLGKGIFTATGERWKRNRKLITPAFHFQILQTFFKIFDSNARILIQKLLAHDGKEAFDVYKYINLYALDNICDSSMGIKVNALENPNSEYVKAIKAMMGLVYGRILTPWLRPDAIFKYTMSGRLQKKTIDVIHGCSYEVMEKRKQEFDINGNINFKHTDENEKGKKAFLDLLLDISREGRFTEEEVREEVDTIMFGGHDTVSSSLSFILYALAEHQDIQEKVFQELTNIFGTSDRDTTYDDVQKMKYMEQVIKEALRFYTITPTIGRKFNEDFPLNENQYIPKNTEVVIVMGAIHRDPKIWPNPDVFDPDRFLLEASQNRDPFAFIPFSAGPRNCIGQKYAMYEMKISISKVLTNFKILLSDNPQDKIRPKFGFILTSSNGMMIKVQSRRENQEENT